MHVVGHRRRHLVGAGANFGAATTAQRFDRRHLTTTTGGGHRTADGIEVAIVGRRRRHGDRSGGWLQVIVVDVLLQIRALVVGQIRVGYVGDCVRWLLCVSANGRVVVVLVLGALRRQ